MRPTDVGFSSWMQERLGRRRWWRRLRLSRHRLVGDVRALNWRWVNVQLIALGIAFLCLAGLVVAWWDNLGAYDYGILRSVPSPDAPGAFLVLALMRDGPAARAGLWPGDVLLLLDGEPLPDDASRFRRAWAEQAAPVTFRVRRVSTEPSLSPMDLDLTVNPAPRLTMRDALLELLASSLLVVIGIGAAALVFATRPWDLAARLLLATIASFSYVLSTMAWHWTFFEWRTWIDRAHFLLFVFGSALLLHLCLEFPARNPVLERLRGSGPPAYRRLRGVVALYTPPLVLAALLMTRPREDWPWAYAVGVGLLMIGVAALLRSYRNPAGPLACAQLKWILWALGVSVAALALGLILPVATDDRVVVLPLWAMVAICTVFPLALSFAVLRYRLFDVDLVIRSTMFYPLLIGALVVSFNGIGAALQRVTTVIAPEAVSDPLISVGAALAVAALLYPLRLQLSRVVDGLCYRGRYTRERFLREATEQLGRARPLEAITTFLTRRTARSLDLKGAWLLVFDDASTVSTGWPTRPGVGARMPERLSHALGPLLLTLREDLRLSGVETVQVTDEVLAAWYAVGGRTFIPLRVSAPVPRRDGGSAEGFVPSPEAGELIGVWVLGARARGDYLDREDLELLTRVATQAAVLLDYARLYRERAERGVTVGPAR